MDNNFNCGSCGYYQDANGPHVKKLFHPKMEGLCRRYPPTLVTFTDNSITSVWAEVKSNDCCGEWIEASE